jgi:hypothetical protein
VAVAVDQEGGQHDEGQQLEELQLRRINLSGEHAMLGPMTTPMRHRICRRCGEEKPFSEFYRTRDCRDGLRPECKSCTLAAGRQRYQVKAKDPEYRKAVNAANSAWRARNRERARAHQRTYYHRGKQMV